MKNTIWQWLKEEKQLKENLPERKEAALNVKVERKEKLLNENEDRIVIKIPIVN